MARSAQEGPSSEGQSFARSAGAPGWTVFPALALWFVSLQLGLLMASADQANLPRQRLVIVFFLFCQLGFALLFSLGRRKGKASKTRRLFSVVLALGIPACVAAHVSFPYGLWPILALLPSAFTAAITPLIWAAVVTCAPPGRQGLYLGLSMAAGEFVWISLLPFLPNMYEAGAQGSAQLAYLHIVQALLQTTLCGLLIRWLREQPELFAAAPPDRTPEKIGARLLFPLFLAETLFFLLSGFALGAAFPETIPDQRPSLYVPVIFLTLAPVIGLLLDKNRHGVRWVAAFLAVCALVISLAPLRIGEPDFFLLFFYIGRDSLLLLFWFILMRLAGGRLFFPLLPVLVLSLNGVSHAGMWLVHAAPPDTAGYAAPGLAVCFAALIAYLCRGLKGDALAPSAPPPEAAPEAAPEAGREAGRGVRETGREAGKETDREAPRADEAAPETNRKAPEAVRKTPDRNKLFDERRLTEKEKEIAVLVLQGLSNDEIAARLHRSQSAIKIHIRNILHKFGVTNRRLFLSMFLE